MLGKFTPEIRLLVDHIKLGKCFSTAFSSFTEFVFFLFFFYFFFLQCSNAKCINSSKIQTNDLSFMKFGMGVHLDNIRVGPKNQGHGSKVKVARFKNVI